MIAREDVTFEYWTTSKAKVSVRRILHKGSGTAVSFEEARITEEEALAALEQELTADA